MAKYDQGGGCPCGLNLVCDCVKEIPIGPKDNTTFDDVMGEDKSDVFTEITEAYDLNDLAFLIRPLLLGLIVIGVIISPYIVLAVLLFFILESNHEIKSAIDNLKKTGYQG